MLRNRLSACAELVLRDAATNNMSLVNILDVVGVFGFPTLLAKLGCLFVLERDATDVSVYQGELVLSIGQRELGRSPVTADFQDQLTTRVMIATQGVMLTEAGSLTFRLVIGGEVLGSWSIAVTEVAGAPTPVAR